MSSNRVKRIAAPRWRHFFPIAESFTMKIPYYATSRDSITGKVSVIEKFRIDYVAEARVENDYTFYQLASNMKPKKLENISISFNGVNQQNETIVLRSYEQNGVNYTVSGPRSFFYDAATNRINYQYVKETGYNRAPAIGTVIVIEITNEVNTDNLYVKIPMTKWLLQGANPYPYPIPEPTVDEETGEEIPPTVFPIPTEEETLGDLSFRGAYRCTLMIIKRPTHGNVRIADNKLAFEYRPDMGYYGTDSFEYRVVNYMGQESQTYIIDLDVGTDKIK